jgi:hypothetical protein
MKRPTALASLLLASLPVLAATEEQLTNAPVQTADPLVVWIFLIGFIGAIVAGCIWYFYPSNKKDK